MDGNYLRFGQPRDAGTSDEQLYDRFRRTRDREALGLLLDRYSDRLTLFLCGIVQQEQEAEEIMLDTFAAQSVICAVSGMCWEIGRWIRL